MARKKSKRQAGADKTTENKSQDLQGAPVDESQTKDEELVDEEPVAKEKSALKATEKSEAEAPAEKPATQEKTKPAAKKEPKVEKAKPAPKAAPKEKMYDIVEFAKAKGHGYASGWDSALTTFAANRGIQGKVSEAECRRVLQLFGLRCS